MTTSARKRHTLADMEARAIQKDRHTEQRDQGGMLAEGVSRRSHASRPAATTRLTPWQMPC
jgi:hypothetical protein